MYGKKQVARLAPVVIVIVFSLHVLIQAHLLTLAESAYRFCMQKEKTNQTWKSVKADLSLHWMYVF